MPVSQQWIRRIQVIVGDNPGNALSIENLRIKFEITKTIEATPNIANIKIYNMNDAHANQIENEFTRVIINAGYKDSFKTVFQGNIRHVFKYREKTDYIVEIDSADGDEAYRNSVVNVAVQKGTSSTNLIQLLASTMKDITVGTIMLPNTTKQRGATYTGHTRDILTHISKGNGANWSIQDGQLTIVPSNQYLPTQAIVVNSNTGLLTAPEISDKGIAVKTLLNPQFLINGAIQLDNNDIKLKIQRVPKGGAMGGKRLKDNGPVRKDPDGIYKIIRLDQKGDNRGDQFISELICIGLNDTPPKESRT